jgi:hypothetical protein
MRVWEHNYTMNLIEIVCDDGDWINLFRDRDQRRGVVKTVMYLWIT